MPNCRALLVHGDVGDVFLIQEDAARVGGYQADDCVEAGGLAGAVRAKQTNNFALPDAKTDAVYNSAAAIRLTDFFCGQNLHLTYHSRLGNGRRTAVAFNDDPIIASIQSQRNPGNLAMFGIKNARRSAGEDELVVGGGVDQGFAGAPAVGFGDDDGAGGDDFLQAAGTADGDFAACAAPALGAGTGGDARRSTFAAVRKTSI